MKTFGTIAFLLLVSLSSFAFQRNSGRVKGQLEDLKGNPIVGAKMVFTVQNAEKPEDADFQKEIESKVNGDFVLAGLSSNIHIITITKEGFYNRTYGYRQTAATRDLVIQMMSKDQTLADLPPQPTVKGRIVDTKGNPIAGASVELYSKDISDLKREPVMTNENGEYVGEGFQNCIVEVYARKEGYRDQIYRAYQSDQEAEFDIEMMTIEEAYRAMGLEPPTEKEPTPEEKAIEFYNLSVDPYKEKDFATAESYARQALELDPKQLSALKMAVYTNQHQNDWEDVLKYANQYLELKPDDEGILAYATEAARVTKKTDLFKEHKAKLREVKGITPDSVYNEAVQALNQYNDEEALKLLNELLGLDSEYAMAYYQLGLLYIREGDFDKALKNLKLFLKHAPEDHKNRAEVTDLVVSLSE